MDKFIFKNCDYKDLLKELAEQKIKIDAVITDPPYGVAENISLALAIWAEPEWTMVIGITTLTKRNGFDFVRLLSRTGVLLSYSMIGRTSHIL